MCITFMVMGSACASQAGSIIAAGWPFRVCWLVFQLRSNVTLCLLCEWSDGAHDWLLITNHLSLTIRAYICTGSAVDSLHQDIAGCSRGHLAFLSSRFDEESTRMRASCAKDNVHQTFFK